MFIYIYIYSIIYVFVFSFLPAYSENLVEQLMDYQNKIYTFHTHINTVLTTTPKIIHIYSCINKVTYIYTYIYIYIHKY